MKNVTGHTEAPTQVGGFPPFQTDTFASQLVWLAISFAVLYVLVAKFGLPRVGTILEERRRHVAADVAEANRNKAESHAVMNAYESALDHARRRAGGLVGKVQKKLNADAKKSRSALDAELKARLSDAEHAIATAKEAAAANVRAIAIEATSVIVARLIGTVPANKVVVDAVDRAIKR